LLSVKRKFANLYAKHEHMTSQDVTKCKTSYQY